MKDDSSFNKINQRDKIMQQIDALYKTSVGIGKNPYTVNIISFSGQGFYCNGEEIAVIPEFSKEDNSFKIRFINFSALARKFAERKNSINIFILSKCRIDESEIIFKYNGEQIDPERDEFQRLREHLNEDVFGKNKCQGYS